MNYREFRIRIIKTSDILGELIRRNSASPDEMTPELKKEYESVKECQERFKLFRNYLPNELEVNGNVQSSDIECALMLLSPIIKAFRVEYLYNSWFAMELYAVQSSLLNIYLELYIAFKNYTEGSHRTMESKLERYLSIGSADRTEILSFNDIQEIDVVCKAALKESLSYYRDMNVDEM